MREKYESLSLAVLKELAKKQRAEGNFNSEKSSTCGTHAQEDEKEAQKAHAGEAERC